LHGRTTGGERLSGGVEERGDLTVSLMRFGHLLVVSTV
jgi:hypothetical protein